MKMLPLLIAAAVLTPPGPHTAQPDDGAFTAPVSSGAVPVVASVTLDAMPYERTVLCDAWEFTGSYTGSPPTTWTASPSGETGACTNDGAGSLACIVDIDPDAVGEGVETITIGDATVTVGFYVDGEHSCFLSQSVDNAYNITKADLDAVSTWRNLGTSGLDVTQATGAAQPTFRATTVNGQPTVRCDGGDRLAASTAADWAFLHDGSGATIDATVVVNSASTTNNIAATSAGINTSKGIIWRTAATAATSFGVSNGAGSFVILAASANNAFAANTFNNHLVTLASADTPDHTQYVNNASVQSGNPSAALPTGAPAAALNLCAESDAGLPLTGDLFRVIFYPSSLTSTQRGINKAVDEWALGAALPVAPPTLHLDASYLASVTTASSSVSSWRSTGILTWSATEATNPPAHSGTGSTAQVDFDGTNDLLTASGFAPSADLTAGWHIVAVVTPDAVSSNGTGASCYLNDAIANDNAQYRGLYLRSSAGVTYAIAYNYDGTSDCAETTITVGTKQILDASHTAGNVRIGVNGGALTSVASGNPTTSPTSVRIGLSGTEFFDGKVHELLWYPRALTTTERADLIASLQTKWGI